MPITSVASPARSVPRPEVGREVCDPALEREHLAGGGAVDGGGPQLWYGEAVRTGRGRRRGTASASTRANPPARWPCGPDWSREPGRGRPCRHKPHLQLRSQPRLVRAAWRRSRRRPGCACRIEVEVAALGQMREHRCARRRPPAPSTWHAASTSGRGGAGASLGPHICLTARAERPPVTRSCRRLGSPAEGERVAAGQRTRSHRGQLAAAAAVTSSGDPARAAACRPEACGSCPRPSRTVNGERDETTTRRVRAGNERHAHALGRRLRRAWCPGSSAQRSRP